MPAGDVFDTVQRAVVARALENAGRATGLTFCLRVGPAEGVATGPRGSLPRSSVASPADSARPYACRLHAERGPEAADTVLVFVDPKSRRLEIVTGSRARRVIDDATCARAAAAMTGLFASGDLAGGLVAGLAVLGEPAPRTRARRTKSAGQPAKKPPSDQSQSTLF